jgi:uncharacterized delta-60 repeat protein
MNANNTSQIMCNDLPGFKGSLVKSFLILICGFWLTQPTQAAPGDLDLTFGIGGKATSPIGSLSTNGRSVIVQTDGKIIVAGYAYVSPTTDFVVARYNPNGTFDAGFGNNGFVVTSVGISEDKAFSAVLQADGKIVVVGTVWAGLEEFGVVRYNQNGTLDNSFNGSGKVITDVTNNVSNDSAYSAQIQSDGKILVGGTCANRFCLVRYNTDGSLDTSFDGDGKVITTTTLIEERAVSLTLQPDGKIVMVGSARQPNADYEFLTVRYNTDGSLDLTFDDDGKAMTSLHGFLDYATAVAMQPDGKIVVAGGSYRPGDPQRPDVFTDYDVAITRYNPDGSLDSTFDFDGKTTIRFGQDNDLFNDYATGIAIQQNSKILVGGYSWNGSRNNFTLARFNPGGLLDPNFGTNGKIVTAVRNTEDQAFAIALQADGKILEVGQSHNGSYPDFAVVRYYGDAVSVISHKPYDFDGDGRADLSVRRPSDNIWYILRGFAGYFNIEFGVIGDLMAPADYDGDGKTDVCVFRPSNGTWYTFNSQSQSFTTTSWGANGDVPVPADYDADARADLVVFRPSTNTWYTRFANGTFSTTVFGVAGDKPVVGDFDGDGKADIALYRPSDSNWYILKTGFGFFVQTWGQTGDIPVPADYDGDGKTDVSVFRPSTGQWFRIQSTAGFDTVNWGVNGDKPIPADYDGDGKADVAVFRPSNATWYIVGSTSGQLIQNYGVAGDLPTQGAFIY